MCAAVLLAAAAGGCKRHPERTPEGALARLRDSLATGNPPIARVADSEVINQAEFLTEASFVQTNTAIPLGPTAIGRAMDDIRRRGEPATYFAGVLTLLRQGHCERIAAAPLPDPIRSIPEPNDRWPHEALDIQHSVARRLQGATAGDYRCDGGPSFRAAFVRGEPDDGTPRVAYIGPSSVR